MVGGVPVALPLFFVPLALNAYLLATLLLGSRARQGLVLVPLSVGLLLVVDLVLDPAAVAIGFWTCRRRALLRRPRLELPGLAAERKCGGGTDPRRLRPRGAPGPPRGPSVRARRPGELHPALGRHQRRRRQPGFPLGSRWCLWPGLLARSGSTWRRLKRANSAGVSVWVGSTGAKRYRLVGEFEKGRTIAQTRRKPSARSRSLSGIFSLLRRSDSGPSVTALAARARPRPFIPPGIKFARADKIKRAHGSLRSPEDSLRSSSEPCIVSLRRTPFARPEAPPCACV